MKKRTIRNGLGSIGLVIVLMTPADAFTFGDLAGVSTDDGDGHAATAPWFRNIFVKIRAAGTHPVELPDRAPPKRRSAKAKPAPPAAPLEGEPPDTVQNLHRVDAH